MSCFIYIQSLVPPYTESSSEWRVLQIPSEEVLLRHPPASTLHIPYAYEFEVHPRLFCCAPRPHPRRNLRPRAPCPAPLPTLAAARLGVCGGGGGRAARASQDALTAEGISQHDTFIAGSIGDRQSKPPPYGTAVNRCQVLLGHGARPIRTRLDGQWSARHCQVPTGPVGRGQSKRGPSRRRSTSASSPGRPGMTQSGPPPAPRSAPS